jgi:hypothetical protein
MRRRNGRETRDESGAGVGTLFTMGKNLVDDRTGSGGDRDRKVVPKVCT